MFRATHRPSSGAHNCTSSLWFCIRERLLVVMVAGRVQQPQRPTMADCVATGDSSLYVLPLIKDRISDYICKKCSAYESQLKEVLEELESVKTIINILQTQPQRTRAVNKPTQRNGLQYLPETTQPGQIKVIYVNLRLLINIL